jgi:LysM repeat protein
MRWVLSKKKSIGRLAFVAALMLVLSLFLVAAQPAEAQGTTGVYHIVQFGEYLSLIAQRYGTTVAAILAANPQITNPNRIYTGQTIFVPLGVVTPPPPPPPPPTCRAYHVVQPGQNLFRIGLQYGVSYWAIAQANGIGNVNRIYAGTTLCIP